MTTRQLQPTIEVDRDDFVVALKHGMDLWYDGSTPTKRLDQREGRSGFTRFVNARIEGKIAEVAFSTFLDEYYGIESRVDWRIYGDYTETDHGDLQYLVGDDGDHYEPAVQFDVKKTKPWNQWLAIRTEIFEKHPDDAPFVLTKLSIEDDVILDEWEDAGEWDIAVDDDDFCSRVVEFGRENFPLDVELVGTAYKDEFTDEFDQGDRLYDPDTGREIGPDLRRDNFGIHVGDLVATRERWDRVVDEITDGYPIGYEELS